MGSKLKIIAIIPAHNEARTIGRIITETKKYIKDVVVIDDASTDNTYKVAEEAGALVLRHVYNGGYGAAQRTGQIYAIRKGFDYVLQLDGDGQHDPRYIPEFIKNINYDCYDFIIGSRFLNKSYKKFSLIRKVGIKFFTLFVKNFGVTKISDVTSGFKAYKIQSLKKLSRTSDLHPAVEQMLEMIKKGFVIKEIPVRMRLRYAGKSHLTFSRFVFYPLRAFKGALRVIIYR